MQYLSIQKSKRAASFEQRYVQVDDVTYEQVKQLRWIQNAKGYVMTSKDGKITLLASLIVQAEPGQVVAYVDGNKLNCQRQNLKVMSRKEWGFVVSQMRWKGKAVGEVPTEAEMNQNLADGLYGDFQRRDLEGN